MNIKLYKYLPIKKYMRLGGLNESAGARLAKISRLTLRAILRENNSFELKSLISIAQALELNLTLLLTRQTEVQSELSTYAIGLNVIHDGADSWKIHFMNFVDEFRKTLDARLILLPPPRNLNQPLRALLASIVIHLCEETEISAPDWATKNYFLEKPWFLSEMESLKAMAVLESPLAFRKNNIFVQNNFLGRA